MEEFFLVTVLLPSINLFLMLSFKSKQPKVAGCFCRSRFKSHLTFSFTCLCNRVPQSRDQQDLSHQNQAGKVRMQKSSQNNVLKNSLKAVTPTLLPEFMQLLLIFYSLYFCNFSSGAYWLKNKYSQQPTLIPLNEKTATQQLRIIFSFEHFWLQWGKTF